MLKFALFSDSIFPLAVMYTLFEFSDFIDNFTGTASSLVVISFLSSPQETNSKVESVMIDSIFFIILFLEIEVDFNPEELRSSFIWLKIVNIVS